MFSPSIPMTWRARALGQGGAWDPLAQARGRLFPFAPVALGTGIALYFALPREPDPGAVLALACAALALLGLAWRVGAAWRPAWLALGLVAAGIVVASWRASGVAAPVLGWHRYGPVEGRVVEVDRSVSDAVRITLDDVVLPGLSPLSTPRSVRLSLHGDPPGFVLRPGLRVATTAHLSPPGGPVEPDGFDFRRIAWFEGLGAVGYTRVPLVRTAPSDGGWAVAIGRFRRDLAEGVHDRNPGPAGGVVAALLTGDRYWVDAATTDVLRRANLSHLLAISGLHMGLLTGVVFALLRACLAAVPGAAATLALRKIAAVGALGAATLYLVMSGGNVATQRAYVMAVVMLIAVLIDRRAVSVRSVAVAALILLVWRPESLLSAGFQMSFAATLALVAVFEGVNRRLFAARNHPWQRRVLVWALTVVLCSLVAGLATAPISAVHFHRFANFGLVANVLSVPLMGLVIMPAAVLAAIGGALGWADPGLWLMALGVRWILAVAHWVAALPQAIVAVPSPPTWALPVLAAGGLWLVLWPRWTRTFGLVPLACALWFWGAAPRPVLLVAEGGVLAGLLGPEGRALSRARGAGFVARLWLENDGDLSQQADAALRDGMQPFDGGARFEVLGARWVHLVGRRGEAMLSEVCRGGVTVIVDFPVSSAAYPCTILDARMLTERGAMAVYSDGSTRFAHEAAGQRFWSQDP